MGYVSAHSVIAWHSMESQQWRQDCNLLIIVIHHPKIRGINQTELFMWTWKCTDFPCRLDMQLVVAGRVWSWSLRCSTFSKSTRRTQSTDKLNFLIFSILHISSTLCYAEIITVNSIIFPLLKPRLLRNQQSFETCLESTFF